MRGMREMSKVPVAVYAADRILQAGVAHQLRLRPEVEVLDLSEEDRAEVSLVVVDRLDEASTQLLRRLHRTPSARAGLVAGQFDRNALQTTVECGVSAVLRREDANPDSLVRMITAITRGEGMLPGDMLGQLLDHVGRLQRQVLDPNGLTLSTLTAREVGVLRLVSEGFDTAEIATKMSYSERTVKNVLHEVSTRLQLRNRAHAVGHAMRHGLI